MNAGQKNDFFILKKHAFKNRSFEADNQNCYSIIELFPK